MWLLVGFLYILIVASKWQKKGGLHKCLIQNVFCLAHKSEWFYSSLLPALKNWAIQNAMIGFQVPFLDCQSNVTFKFAEILCINSENTYIGTKNQLIKNGDNLN